MEENKKNEINYKGLKITPRAIEKAEKVNDIDYYRIMLEVSRTKEVPKYSEMLKMVYIGVLGSGKEINYDEFLDNANLSIDEIYTFFNDLINQKPKN